MAGIGQVHSDARQHRPVVQAGENSREFLVPHHDIVGPSKIARDLHGFLHGQPECQSHDRRRLLQAKDERAVQSALGREPGMSMPSLPRRLLVGHDDGQVGRALHGQARSIDHRRRG
jgi:hypothetical protein